MSKITVLSGNEGYFRTAEKGAFNKLTLIQYWNWYDCNNRG